jgi:hypothetical protein
LEALLRRWLGRVTAGEVLKERVNLETGAVSRDDMAMMCGCESSTDKLLDGLVGGISHGLNPDRQLTLGSGREQADNEAVDGLQMEGELGAGSTGEGRYK